MKRVFLTRRMLTFLAWQCVFACTGQRPPAVVHLVPEGAEEQPLAVGKASRMGFRAPVGTGYHLSFEVPESDPTLSIACAAAPAAGPAGGGDAAFRAVVTDPDGNAEAVFEEMAASGRWSEAIVDMEPYAGEQVELLLASAAVGRGPTGHVYWATPVAASRAPERANVLLISIDSLRPDHLGCYGYPRPTSPTIDSLAANGCLFRRAIAQSSWTLPSHVSLLTSMYMRSHGVGSARQALSPRASTLAEALRKNGYVTGAIVSGGPMDAKYGLDQGFDTYNNECHTESLIDSRNHCTHRRAIAWLRRLGHSPFFLFVHYWDVHYGYVPPAPYDTLFDAGYTGTLDGRRVRNNQRIHPGMPRSDLQHLVALYDGEIAHTDRYLGLLFRELGTLGLAERTLLVLTSDHGDELLEHGATGHAHSLFQELIHVPRRSSRPWRSESGGLTAWAGHTSCGAREATGKATSV